VAHVCWQYVDLGPAVPDVAAAARRARLICDAYGLADRGLVVETILWWQDRCWRGIEAAAQAGVPEMIGLRDRGTARSMRGAYQWVATHRAALETMLR
jgi:hypothetical protein